MRLCQSCEQVYDDYLFISSGGSICDYCFAMLGLGHGGLGFTMNVDFMQKGRMTPVRSLSPLMNFEMIPTKGSVEDVTKLYHQGFIRGLQTQERTEDEGIPIPGTRTVSDVIQFPIPQPVLRFGY